MVDTTEEVEVSESQIAAHWQEEELIHPSAAFIAQANMADSAVHERFKQENFPEYFREYADLLSWDQYWHTTLDTANPPFLEVVRRREAER
jgi:acetyl-CoA synthetase